MNYKINNLDLCSMIWNLNCSETKSKVDQIIEEIQNTNLYTGSQISQIHSKLLNIFFPQYLKKWKTVTRKKAKFITKYATFLRQDFVVTFKDDSNNTTNTSQISEGHKKGRPRIQYDDGSERTKKRRSDELASNYSKEELANALQRHEINTESDLKMDSTKNTCNQNQALAMFMDLNLTAKKYSNMKTHHKIITGTDMYPSYATILQAKKDCYPEHIDISESGASVNIISLLVHTTKRILSLLDKRAVEGFEKKLLLVGKWGMDGASGQQTTRQKWSDTSCGDDNAVFVISFTPLLLKAGDDIIWSNKTPSSVHFCRVLKFSFVKESTEVIINEYNKCHNLLEKVKTYCFDFNDVPFEVNFDLKCTMIDGKVCNVLTNQKASNCCNICRVGPKLINDLEYVKTLPCNESFYKFGLSTLHCWIRSMEYLLHIAYNMDFQKSAARTSSEKEMKKSRKQKIQKLLNAKLSLPVDIVKQGFGTTNTGNVARSFFRQAEAVSKYTRLDETLIRRLHHILQLLTCGRRIDCDKFAAYCSRTAEICVELYGWYKMPPSIHKILLHGSQIIRSFDLPFGWLSEEPQEGNNKIFRKARSQHSRMCNRKSTNNDIFHFLLVASDPVISTLRIKEEKENVPLSKESENMLL